MKEQEKERLRNSLYIVFSLFTISFFGFFAVNPTLSTISNLRRQYEDSKKVEKALREKITALDILTQEFEQIRQDLHLIEVVIPKSSSLPYLAVQLEQIAEDNGVEIKGLSFGSVDLYRKEKGGSQPLPIDITLNVEGEGGALDAFLSDIIHFDRLVVIDSFSLEKRKEEQRALSLTGKVFFRRE